MSQLYQSKFSQFYVGLYKGSSDVCDHTLRHSGVGEESKGFSSLKIDVYYRPTSFFLFCFPLKNKNISSGGEVFILLPLL